MKTKVRTYRGYLITSFAMRQLGDPEVTGTSYSVYTDEAHYTSGEDPLSACENLITLTYAMRYVDGLIQTGGGAP